MSRLRRGFTLIELVVYLSLITVGMLLVGAVEMTAKRSVDQQRSLIDVQLQGDAFLGRLRRDVEAARQVRVESGVPTASPGAGADAPSTDVLGLTLGDGTRVRWGVERTGSTDVGYREGQDPDGKPHRETFPAVTGWTPRIERVGGRTRVTVTVELEAGARQAKVSRKRSRTAITRLEVSE